jgi:hypothetical protein
VFRGSRGGIRFEAKSALLPLQRPTLAAIRVENFRPDPSYLKHPRSFSALSEKSACKSNADP